MQQLKDSLSSILGPTGAHIFTNRSFGLSSLIFFIIYVGFLLYTIDRGRKGSKVQKIRRIAGMAAVEEAVGRATEMGRPISFVPGFGGFSAGTFAALGIMGHIARQVAKFDARLIICNGDPNVYPVTQSIVRQSYQEEGKIDAYRYDDVRFLTSNQWGYASAVAGLLIRESVAASVLCGSFYAEAVVFAETGYSVGAIQVAGTDVVSSIPFFVSSCDYTLLGEELFAASAYISQDKIKTGTIIVQDWGKRFLVVVIALGVLTATISQLTGSSSHLILDLLQLY